MKYIELFAGIGGFGLALNRLGHECVYANEWDKYAAQIYKKNFSKRWIQNKEGGNNANIKVGEEVYNRIDQRDIRTVPTSEIPNHDLLVAGFPCQAFSIAGKRRGFNDTRGTLFFEIARILKDKQPKFFILENVKGLLSHDNGNTFKTIISTLTELGYDLQWQVLNSKNFGVPQNRERVFIVGHIRGQPRPQVFPITKISTGNLKYCWGVVSDRKQWLKDGKSNSRNFSQGQRIYSAGGISQTLAGNAGGQGGKTGLYAIPTNTKLGYDLAEEKEDGIRLEHPNSKTARGRVIKGASQSLKTSAQVGVIDNMKIRRLTPTECERLQGFPDGFTEGVSDTQRYKTLGNAVTVNVVYEVARRLTLNTTLQTTDTTGFVSVRNK
jgi:DNA (cytosine-5)-methyltransferase 1